MSAGVRWRVERGPLKRAAPLPASAIEDARKTGSESYRNDRHQHSLIEHDRIASAEAKNRKGERGA